MTTLAHLLENMRNYTLKSLSVTVVLWGSYLLLPSLAPAVPAASFAKSKSSDSSLLKKSSEGFRYVAKKVGPAVVTIKASQQPPVVARRGRPGHRGMPPEGNGDDLFGNDQFLEFFRQFGLPFEYRQPTPQTAAGSGFIIRSDGYIVTNNHVVEGANKIVITLPSEDGEDLVAKVVGRDPRSDLAVLKVKSKKPLPVAEWADSDEIEVGDWAIAIGSPFMLTHSVTVGIVSAKGRSSRNLIGSDYSYDMLQTDAAINPGNSGGPLCTVEGKVMGVNTAIFTRSGGYMGIGFAIPSNLAKKITSSLIESGKVVYGWLGVVIQPVTKAMAKDLGVKTGVVIHEVQPDSPAKKAGLKSGDVIVEMDGKKVKDASEVQSLVSGYSPGKVVNIKVINYNDRKTREVSVKIGELPGQMSSQSDEEGDTEGDTAPDKLGLVVHKVKQGVQVVGFSPASIGRQVGVKKGDIITSVNRTRITSVSQYKKLVDGSAELYMGILRGNQEIFFSLQLGN